MDKPIHIFGLAYVLTGATGAAMLAAFGRV
jgi:hypothetical protein